MRVNSFPCMTVDISNGPHRGDIYIVWANIGVPGINTGDDIDVYMIRSSDQGLTWTAPQRINQDASGLGKEHFFPWITSDPANGHLSVIFYDDRNVSAPECEVYVANSIDGGNTWSDFKVSDVAFTPQPIGGLADSYFGDYLGITANDRQVYPCWTDNRSDHAMTYVSPFTLGPPPNQPFVNYSSYLIDDIATGNGNGTLDFGETVQLNLGLTNIGDQPASNVNVLLSSPLPYISFTDSIEIYGDFAVNESKTIPDAFSFTVSPNAPDGTNIPFTVIATDANDSVFISNFSIEVHSPGLAIGGYSISDPIGNNNGRLDPGETADLKISVSNPGDFTSLNVTSSLISANPLVTLNNTTSLLDTINPGQTKFAVFSLSVSATAISGSAAGFDFTASSNLLTTQKTFTIKIGEAVEDWETGDFTKFPWELVSDSNWTIDSVTNYEGDYAARSGNISDNQYTELYLTYDVMNDDSISFYRKVSSEDNYDELQFYVDADMLGTWSGEQDWARVAFPVTQGYHAFTWRYMKDQSVSGGSDAAWVDYIVLPTEVYTSAFAGTDASICQTGTYQCQGSATKYTTLAWSTSGSGTFDNPAQLNAIYTPSAGDIAAGTVSLTLTVTGFSTGEIATDEMVLTFNAPATAYAGNDGITCEGSPFQITGSSATNYHTVHWRSFGDGIFNDISVLMPTYIPGPNDVTSGNVKLTLTAVTGNGCPNVTDSVKVIVYPLPTMQVSAADTVCQGDSIQATFTLTGSPPWTVVDGSSVAHEMLVSPWTTWIIPLTTTTFNFLSIIDANGCINNNPIAAAVYVKPSAIDNLGIDTVICANHSIMLNAYAPGTLSYLWMPGGLTSSSITVDSAGTGLGTREYSVTIMNESGCQTTFSKKITFTDCAGIEEMAGNISFLIYPNPNNGSFFITLKSKSKENVRLQLLNLLNQVMETVEQHDVKGQYTKDYNLCKKGAGTYLLHITNGNTTVSRKVIIIQ
jgi:hypothetical protein